jgi:hypothetical protein
MEAYPSHRLGFDDEEDQRLDGRPIQIVSPLLPRAMIIVMEITTRRNVFGEGDCLVG